jgi:hypothetical protein
LVQHGDQRQEITAPIIDKSACTSANVNVISNARLAKVAGSSNGISKRL